MFTQLLNWLSEVFKPRTAPVAASPATESPAVIEAPQPRKGGNSPALARTLEALAERPGITAAELAKHLSISPSWARTLLRRARSQAPAAVSPSAATPVPDRLEHSVTELSNRLEAAEATIQQLRIARPTNKISWDVNRRAEVLRRNMLGESPERIAGDLRIPSGEVAFILKVHQILVSNS